LSSDWLIFQSFMGNIGAFTYIAEKRTAFLDPVAREMLSCRNTKLNEFEFFNLLEKISGSPVEANKHIYKFTSGKCTRYIKMNIYENNSEWLGFVQDFTRIFEITNQKDNITSDPVTHLPVYEVFSEKIRKYLNKEKCYFSAVYINGTEKLNSFLTVENTRSCIASVADVIRSFENERIITGRRSDYGIYIFFRNCTKTEVCNILENINNAVRNCTPTDDFGEIIDISSKSTLSISAGCAEYPDEATDLETLINYSEFALYEIRNDRKSIINWFSGKNYTREEDSYKETQAFMEIIRHNLVTYHFQPIVDTHTGNIIGYETLMRTTGEKRMSPKQIMKIADEQNALYTIEKMTFFNNMRIISENRNVFRKRRLFINSIVSDVLNDDDFNQLYLDYGEFLSKIVIEVSQENSDSQKGISTIKKRGEFTDSKLAIGDYWTGYSNSANLLKYSPDYIKIDRSLISDIQNDLKKQQLVTQVTDFCHDNKLKSIAECIETAQELKTVIRLGVDYVQGYYISKPRPVFLKEISSTIKDEIIKTNLETRPDGQKKIYNAQNDTEINILELALEKYTDIHVYQSRLVIVGDPEKQVKMNISVMDNHSCEIILKNVNITSGNSRPVISVGEYARLVLNVTNNNRLGYSGIYVPMGSQFELTGNGSLFIDCQSPEGIGIGNDYDHNYGDITINMTGNLEIVSNSIETLCIGGGFNDDDSEINLISGKIKISMHTHNGLAVGSFNGDSIINISENCSLDINCSGIRIAGIGSFRGIASVTSSADIDIFCTGAQAVGMGAIEDSDGSIIINSGKISMKMRSANNSCIGAVSGTINTKITNAEININSEGDEVTGIGTVSGAGKVIISDSDIKIKILAGNPADISSGDEVNIIN
ncbi:MAG: GGDEF domain-containing protein, partial [Ruminococcus sp.]|nr:GGDEF domain-containing protein [Ruminococcus sp.]